MSAMISDLVLITDIRTGCEKAFRLVYHRFHQKLYFYFLQKTRSPDISEELVQLAFIKLWQYRQSLNEQLPVSQQLFRIAKTTLVDLLRQKAANRLVPVTDLSNADIADEPAVTNDNPRLTVVQQTLSHLPPMQRKIVAFRLEGLSNKEIAGRLAISKKTVENQINRAIREIRKKVNHSLILFYIINMLSDL